jgi:peptidoglycan/xylan/chitin deacetylase (PgdA/CDA1 family)
MSDLPHYQRALYKLFHSFGVTGFARVCNRSRVTILCYHGITECADPDPGDRSQIWVMRSRFRSHLQFLARHYRVISLRSYLEMREAGENPPPHSVILTFDDGLRNFLTVAAPVLRESRLPATLFIVTDSVEKRGDSDLDSHWTPADDHTSLSWPEIHDLLFSKEIEIGSHTRSHPVLSDLTSAEVALELDASLRDLCLRIRTEFLPYLAYPYGAYSETIVKTARELGYCCALTTDAGTNSRYTDVFRLRRAVVRRFDTAEIFAARVSGLLGWLQIVRNAFRRLKMPTSLVGTLPQTRPH